MPTPTSWKVGLVHMGKGGKLLLEGTVATAAANWEVLSGADVRNQRPLLASCGNVEALFPEV